jgi:hypothetical protein
MKRLAIIMAVILGIIPGIILNANTAFADQKSAGYPAGIIAENSEPILVPDQYTVEQRDVFEINFTIRAFLWAVSNRRPEILVKTVSPVLRAEFPNPQTMLIALSAVHAPVIGAKYVFLHIPDFTNGFVVQAVYLDDRFGNPWKATYILRRSENGQYGVTGCFVKKLVGEFS